MKITKIIKSLVLGGALSFWVFAGGHFTQAAGPDKVETEHAVTKERSTKADLKGKHAGHSVKKVKHKAEAAAKPKAKKASKSQASAHASQTAKEHANKNSAVHRNNEEAVTAEVYIQESVKVETEATVETQDTTPVTESQETANHDNTTGKTEDEDHADEDSEKDEKVSPSIANKAKAQASDNARKHAAENSAVLAVQSAIEETTTEKEITEEVAIEETTIDAEIK